MSLSELRPVYHRKLFPGAQITDAKLFVKAILVGSSTMDAIVMGLQGPGVTLEESNLRDWFSIAGCLHCCVVGHGDLLTLAESVFGKT